MAELRQLVTSTLIQGIAMLQDVEDQAVYELFKPKANMYLIREDFSGISANIVHYLNLLLRWTIQIADDIRELAQAMLSQI